MNTSPIFFQSRMFWGHIPQVEVLEIEAPEMGSKTFPFQEEAGSYSFPPRYVCEYGKIVSQPLLIFFDEFYLIYPMSRSHSACFCISFKGNVSICGCRLGVSMRIAELSLLCHHLKPANYIPILIPIN